MQDGEKRRKKVYALLQVSIFVFSSSLIRENSIQLVKAHVRVSICVVSMLHWSGHYYCLQL